MSSRDIGERGLRGHGRTTNRGIVDGFDRSGLGLKTWSLPQDDWKIYDEGGR